jgi:cell division protein FtsI/penicillin-binding protein 2
MVALLTIAFVGLGFRLVDLQLLRHEVVRPQAESRTRRTFIRIPLRGQILDRRHTVLATSEIVKTVVADLGIIGTNDFIIPFVARALAPVLQTNATWLEQRLASANWTNTTTGQVRSRRSVILKRKVSMDDWDRIHGVMTNLTFGLDVPRLSKAQSATLREWRYHLIGSEMVDDQLRTYPQGELAAHVLGFVGAEERRTNVVIVGTSPQERRTNQTIVVESEGRSGVEYMMNDALTGVPGWRRTEVARARELASYREQDVEPHHGHHVVLTLDAGLQGILERGLLDGVKQYNATGACGLIVRPQTGEILALANWPTYNPNRPGDSPVANWRNRALTDMYEPGSTFKIVPIAAGLNDGVIRLETVLDCEDGLFHYAGRRLKDDHPMGPATVEEILARSSNIGTAKVGLQLGAVRLHEYVRAFGFGESTGVGLQGESGGMLSAPARWGKLRTSRIPIGHGISVTAMQMVMAMSAMANGGRLMKPYLVQQLLDEDRQLLLENQPKLVRQVVSPAVAGQMTAALKRVVSTNGTARLAALNHYAVAGKTGTAEKPGVGGYIHGKYVASFIGFFPADRPELCVAIVLDEPKPVYYGGKTAAPVFRDVAERCAQFLALKPDQWPVEDEWASAAAAKERSETPRP